MSTNVERKHFDFTDLESLREWLNLFEIMDLSTVEIRAGETQHVTVTWETHTREDGSTVTKAVFS